MTKWRADGLPVSAEATPAPKAGKLQDHPRGRAGEDRLPELVAAAGDRKNHVLLDALGPEYHYGAAAFFNKQGHIPNAVLMTAEDFYNADKTFKSPQEIRRMLAAGIRADQEVHSHCGGGGAAAVPYFAIRHIAGPPEGEALGGVADGLAAGRSRPCVLDLRRARDDARHRWLHSWGGKMMRMFGVARVSVVDVRAPSAYAQGHVPFAVNVTGETSGGMRRTRASSRSCWSLGRGHHARSRDRLRRRRDPRCGTRLPRAREARAEEGLDLHGLARIPGVARKMARHNFGVTKEATIVGKPAKPTDMAVAPVSYVPALKEGTILADPKAGGGPFPKVFIASGAAVPARAMDGKVVHVPYTDLLKADGTPKAAKDIWARSPRRACRATPRSSPSPTTRARRP